MEPTKPYHEDRRHFNAILEARVDDWIKDAQLEGADGRLKILDGLSVSLCGLFRAKGNSFRNSEPREQVVRKRTS